MAGTEIKEVTEGRNAEQTIKAPVDRERLCNDVMNTSVMAALVGGFALGNLQMPAVPESEHTALDISIYMLAVFSVHACTCSALTSAFIYGVANNLMEEAVEAWAKRCAFMLSLPMSKFSMGCFAYMLSVLLISYRDLESKGPWQALALVIGVMSMSSVIAVYFLLKASLSA